MKINAIDLSTKKKITDLWISYFNEFGSIKPMRLVKVFDSFILSLELHIVRGNISYEPALQLIPLTSENFRVSQNSIFYQTFRSQQGILIWINFNDPVNSANQYFEIIKSQSLLPLFGDIPFSQLIEKVKLVIEKGVVLTRLGIPFVQYEFLIHQAALNPDKNRGLKLFESSMAEIRKFDKERLSYFVNEVENYINNLTDEFNHPEILINRISENMKTLKYSGRLHKILYQ